MIAGRIACVLAALVAAATGAVSYAAETDVLVRWRGGALTQADLQQRYSIEAAELAAGGEGLRVALAKAVYREIMLEAARKAGLADDPRFMLRQQEAASTFYSRAADRLLGLANPTAQDLASEAQTLPQRQHVDIELLVLRCGLKRTERSDCRARFAESAERFRSGESVDALQDEQRLAGRWMDVRLDDLDPGLRKALHALPEGQTADAELLSGPAVVRLLARRSKPDEAAAAVALQERRRQTALQALRQRLGVNATTSDTDLLQQAFPDAMGGSPEQRASRSEWALADFAFEVLPGLVEISADERAAARTTLLSFPAQTWRLTEGDLEQASAVAEALAASEPNTHPALLQSLLGRAADADVSLGPTQLQALPNSLAAHIRKEKRSLGPLILPIAAATGMGLDCAQACMAVTVFGAPQEPDPAAIEAKARRQVRGALGAGLTSWMQRFGRHFEVELLPEPAA